MPAISTTLIFGAKPEARAAASTGHENIVEILDLGFAEDGAPFLVMEYLKGLSLAQTLRKEGPIAPARAANVMGQVLAALAAVHRQGIVHRDLKPDNILLTDRGGQHDFVKVLDFGIAKLTDGYDGPGAQAHPQRHDVPERLLERRRGHAGARRRAHRSGASADRH